MHEPNPYQPTKLPKFSSEISSVFKTFRDGSENLKAQLESSKHIDNTIDDFINKQREIHKDNDYFKSLKKSIETMNLAAEQLQFTLTPLVAKYTDESPSSHFLPALINDTKQIDHVFIEPRFGVEDFYYHYHLFFPLNKKILDAEDPKTMIKEHWNIIYPELKSYAKYNLVRHFKPMYTVSRVYGWDGAWLAYSVAVEDKRDYWSLPLVETTYNGCQPFLAIKGGEFTILQNDKTENSQKKAMEACRRIKKRIEQNKNVQFEKGESIKVAPRWIAAHAISSNGKPVGSFKYFSEDFSSKIGPGSFNKKLETAQEVLNFMRKNTMGTPVYRFKDDDIGACQI